MQLVGYVRVSRADDVRGSVQQREAIERYAKLHRVEIIDVIEEVGASRVQERQGLQQALEIAHRRGAAGILAASIDHLTQHDDELRSLVGRVFVADIS
jgi:DNA invertase Pin-like site-specific DNA recombinase